MGEAERRGVQRELSGDYAAHYRYSFVCPRILKAKTYPCDICPMFGQVLRAVYMAIGARSNGEYVHRVSLQCGDLGLLEPAGNEADPGWGAYSSTSQRE
jgi:hypothetical protein